MTCRVHEFDARQGGAHALELARDPSRAYSLATARAQMAVVHQCRREPEAALEWAKKAGAACEGPVELRPMQDG